MKKILLSVCALLTFSGSAFADDSFSVDNVILPQNGEADVVVRFNLDEGSTCSGYTFWLQVPDELEFVTYEKNGKTYIVYTAGDCYDETPTITANIDEGYLKVGCLTANSDPLNKQSGVLVTFKLKTNSAVNVGNSFTGDLVNGTISAEDGTVHDVADATFTITIVEPVDTRIILDETSTTAPVVSDGAVDVRVLRTINANEWSTICLPFAMTAEQVTDAFGADVELGDFNGYDMAEDGNGIYVKFNPTTFIDANHPYVIKVGTPVTEFTVDGVCIAPDEAVINLGTNRKPKAFIGNYEAETTIENGCLFLNGNKFWYSVGNTKIKAFRAYFDFYNLLPDFENNYAEARIIMAFDNVTGIYDNRIGNEENGERMYDLQGRKINSPTSNFKPQTSKGLYIKGGKKVIIK